MRAPAAATWPDARPLALVAAGAHGLRITAANAAARAEGVRPGLALADARAALPSLATRPAEPRRDAEALRSLAYWAGRYGPARNVEGADGLWVDTTGVAHLYGGEQHLLGDLHRRLMRLGLTARIGLAGTHGAAHALARHAASVQRPVIGVADDAQRLAAALAPLPVAALRIDEEAVVLARRLGLKRIGDLYGLPRESLACRFRAQPGGAARLKAQRADALAEALIERLDAALGRRPEPRESLVEPPLFAARRSFTEPLISAEGIAAAVASLAGDLAAALDAAAQGVRRVRLMLYRVDGTSAAVAIGTAAPVREAAHLVGLLAGKLEHLDAGFGIDMAALEALAVEPLGARQPALGSATVAIVRGDDGAAARALGGASEDDALARLVDRLANRLGRDRVLGMGLRPSHLPERAESRVPLIGGMLADADCAGASTAFQRAHLAASRPALLLEAPEPISVMAEVPDGPPLRFTWRRVEHRVVRAEGPERIAAEWWRWLGERHRRIEEASRKQDASDALGERQAVRLPGRSRDYYCIEDQSGGRYWVFRDGLYGRADEGGAPVWFMHGLFG
ncbi:MAG: DNA polymerase Y family protein [Hyphomicrobiaceae bacterium]